MTKDEAILMSLEAYKQGCVDTLKIVNELSEKTIKFYDEKIKAAKTKISETVL